MPATVSMTPTMCIVWSLLSGLRCGRVVANQVVVTLIGIELQREAARATYSVGIALLAAVENRANIGVRLPTAADKLALVY
jgi:alanine-alpha-ketoisovalerate/valine-pyruvate aminotransferase